MDRSEQKVETLQVIKRNKFEGEKREVNKSSEKNYSGQTLRF